MKHSKKTVKRSSKASITFSSKEFIHHERDHLWYIGMAVLLLAALYITLSIKDYLLSLLVIALGLAMYRVAQLRPSTKKVEITDKGVYWGNHFLAFHQLRSFWIAEVGDHLTLYLDRLNWSPTISVTIPREKAEGVVSFLGQFLPFHDHKKASISDALGRLLRL